MSDLWREKSAFTHFPKLILEAKRRIKVLISKHMDGDDSIHRGKIDIYIYQSSWHSHLNPAHGYTQYLWNIPSYKTQ
jgi:hypothetical protein